MKSKSGFTLVEILVVLVVMALLSSVVAFTYLQQQSSARDDRRATDLKALSSEMERYYQKNGNYPVTCNFTTTSLPQQIRFCGGSNSVQSFYGFFGMTPPAMITPFTTASQLKTTLTSLDDSFNDPRANDNVSPLNQGTADAINYYSYYLLSGDMVTTGGLYQQVFARPGKSAITCSFSLANHADFSNPKPHRYIVGMYSESKQTWRFGISQDHGDTEALAWGPNNTSAGHDDSACTPVAIADL